MGKVIIIATSIMGLTFIILAFVYWFIPANSLPSFLPGYSPSLTTIHFKHGLASLVIGLLIFAFVWFNSKKKSIS